MAAPARKSIHFHTFEELKTQLDQLEDKWKYGVMQSKGESKVIYLYTSKQQSEQDGNLDTNIQTIEEIKKSCLPLEEGNPTLHVKAKVPASQQKNIQQSQTSLFSKSDIANDLWLDGSTKISDEMVNKVNTVGLYLKGQGFVLLGVKADGNCFFHAFLKSYASYSSKIPILDCQQDKDKWLRETVAKAIRKRERQEKVEKNGEWVNAEEGGLLARTLDVPMRIITVNEENGTCGINDMLFSKGKDPTEWEQLENKPNDYIIIVDLGGHFISAKRIGLTHSEITLLPVQSQRQEVANSMWSTNLQMQPSPQLEIKDLSLDTTSLKDEKLFVIPRALVGSVLDRSIKIDRKRKKELIDSLPKNVQEKIERFSKDLRYLQIMIHEMQKLDSQDKINESLKIVKSKIVEMLENYHGFEQMYIESLLTTYDNKEEYFYFEKTRNILINKYLYFYEICSFIDTHKEDIIKVFIKNASKDLLDSTNFVVSLKDINEQKVIEKLNSGKDYFLVDAGDETHHCGKSPAFIYFHAQGKILFKLVYKPRKAETDRIVIETFSKINNLPSSGKSGSINLPIYKIINFPTTNLEISLWEYVDGIDIKNSPSAGAFIVNTFNKQPAKLQEAQNTLNRLDAILTSMEISDLHHQNVKIQFINSISILIVPIDLENRQKAPTQLEGDPKAINLTTPELELIRVANLQLNRMPIRYLPVKTNILALLFHDYSSIDTLIDKINEGLTSDQVQVTMPLEELKIYVLISILNSDIPYFTEYLGKVYYGFPRDGLVIGNIKGFL